ncbi:hypothetical protein QOT17_022204 [Balamuthia mandrillaris]
MATAWRKATDWAFKITSTTLVAATFYLTGALVYSMATVRSNRQKLREEEEARRIRGLENADAPTEVAAQTH